MAETDVLGVGIGPDGLAAVLHRGSIAMCNDEVIKCVK